ncbi:MAG: SDR family NAD(P)-dependent oxidoreductase [Candidatus Micrarchaeia archaeon]
MTTKNVFKGKTVLITGGTGYLGRHLVAEILKQEPQSVRVFSRDEVKHHLLTEEFKDERLRSFVGDVRDYRRVKKATIGADIVVHAAAMKRIDLIEYNVFEAIKTNVRGTMNVAEACLENNVEKAVLVSTDKACSPINTYGATKMLAERVFVESNYSKGDAATVFTAVRYGNVTESTGSAIPFFTDKIKAGEPVPLTDARMTRFFITPAQAVEQVVKAVEYGVGGELFVPRLPAFRITDLIDALKEHYRSKSPVRVTGIRPGEKIDEWMINEDEATRAFDFKDGYAVISQIDRYQETVKYPYLKNAPRVKFKHYSSADALVDKARIRKLLEGNGILK